MPPRRSSSSSPFLSPHLLIILLPIITLIFLFIALPSFLSFTSHLLRPTLTVKKSWDSLNILLVVFAILCGFFARKNDDELSSEDEEPIGAVTSNVAYNKTTGEGGFVSQQWLGFSERKAYDNPPIQFQSPVTGVTRLRRSSSSYPDLRQESLWETGNDRYPFRFFDDLEVEKFRSPMTARDQIPVEHRERQIEVEEVRIKEIPVDTFEIRSSSPPPPITPKSPSPQPPPPPPPAVARHKPRRTYQTVPRTEKVENVSSMDNNDGEFTRIGSTPQTPPPPPTPPPPTEQMRSEHKHRKSERRKSTVKRDIAMIWASVLSNQRKRKNKQRAKSNRDHDYDNVHPSSPESPDNSTPPPAPPPPPPPPPPPSVFHNFFKKGLGKSRKIHSVSKPPSPPPPPPLTSSKRWSKRKNHIPPPPPPPPPPPAPPTAPRRRKVGRPPLPTRVANFNEETIINSGNQSPLIPIPPPPPPPFKLPEMKFIIRGDFVRIRSNHSSRCGSPEPEEVDVPSINEHVVTKTNPVTGNVDGGGSVFCPSPDVNVKAATFIARLRDEWKLEKINSMKEKRTLGHGPSPIPARGPSSSWHWQ